MDKAIEILMVENNPGDIRLAQECFRGNKIGNNLSIVHSSMELLARLQQTEPCGPLRRPDIIMICLSLLLQSGPDILNLIQRDARLHSIPLVVLTCFEGEEEILVPDKSRVDLFLTKPLSLDDMCKIVQKIEDFWIILTCETNKTLPASGASQ